MSSGTWLCSCLCLPYMPQLRHGHKRLGALGQPLGAKAPAVNAPGSHYGAELCAAGCQMQVKCYGSKLGEGICAELSLLGRISVSKASVGRNFSAVFEEK